MKDASFDLSDPDVLRFLQTRNFISAGSFALLLYDYALTMPQEFSSFWRQSSKRTLMPWLFFLARYPTIAFFVLFLATTPGIPLGDQRVFLERYDLIFEIQDWLFFVCIISCEGILMVRTWALWSLNRRMKWVLAVMYSTVLVTAVVMMLYPVWDPEVGEHQQDLFAYATIAALETTIICLTVYRAVFYLQLRGAGRLMLTVYRDGVTYYCAVLALSVANLALQLRFTNKPILLSDLQLAIHSVLCTRIVLHLRTAADSVHPTDNTELSELEFRRRRTTGWSAALVGTVAMEHEEARGETSIMHPASHPNRDQLPAGR